MSDRCDGRACELPPRPPDHVLCDDPQCRALDKPTTIDELRAALEHWRYHSLWSGCSHGS